MSYLFVYNFDFPGSVEEGRIDLEIWPYIRKAIPIIMQPNPQSDANKGATPKANVICVFKLVGISIYSSNHNVGAIIFGKSEKNL